MHPVNLHSQAKEKMSDHFQEARTGAELDVNQLVFRQVDRCNITLAMTPEIYSLMVRGLRGLLIPYIDSEFKAEMKSVEDESQKFQEHKNKHKGQSFAQATAMNEFNWALKEFEELIKLAYRQGFYPKEKDTFEIEGDEENAV